AEPAQEYFILPLWSSYTSTIKSSEAKNGGEKPNGDIDSKINEEPEFVQDNEDFLFQARAARASSTNYVNTASTPVNTRAAGLSYPDLSMYANQDDSQIPRLEDIYEVPSEDIFTSASYDDEGGRLHKFGNHCEFQTRSKVNKSSGVHALIEPKKISQALEDESNWDKIGLQEVVRNKARLVAQGHRQEEGIDYDEVFAPMARIEDIRIFLAFASYMGFIVYQMDVKSAFLYSTIDEEVYVSQPPGFIDPKFPKNVYKVVKALYGLHQAPRAWYATLSAFLEKSGYRRGTIDKTLFIKRDKKDIITISISEASVRRDLLFNDVDGIDCLINQEIYENLQLMGNKPTEPQPTPSPTQPSTGDQPPMTESSYRPDTTQDPEGGHTSDRAEGGLNLDELSVLCTNLSYRVLALETSKGAQAAEILKLKTRIKKLKKKKSWVRSLYPKQWRKKCQIKDQVDDLPLMILIADFALVNYSRTGKCEEGDTLVKMKDNKAKGVVFKDTEELVRPERSVLTLKPLPSINPKDKGKGVLEEPEPAKKMSRSDFDAAQVARDAEVAR
ncbi:putative ribonuclease H-like domain-containing protein, partial [Tanacetum coccineum]